MVTANRITCTIGYEARVFTLQCVLRSIGKRRSRNILLYKTAPKKCGAQRDDQHEYHASQGTWPVTAPDPTPEGHCTRPHRRSHCSAGGRIPQGSINHSEQTKSRSWSPMVNALLNVERVTSRTRAPLRTAGSDERDLAARGSDAMRCAPMDPIFAPSGGSDGATLAQEPDTHRSAINPVTAHASSERNAAHCAEGTRELVRRLVNASTATRRIPEGGDIQSSVKRNFTELGAGVMPERVARGGGEDDDPECGWRLEAIRKFTITKIQQKDGRPALCETEWAAGPLPKDVDSPSRNGQRSRACCR